MNLNYFAALALLSLVTQATCRNSIYTPPTNCEISAIRDNANATGVAPFPGIVIDGPNGEIRSDPTPNWSISTTVTDEGDPSGQSTRLNFWLDTSATVDTNTTTLPYDTCIMLLAGAPQDGDGCISAGCSEALREYYKNSAIFLAGQIGKDGGFSDRSYACQSLVTLKAPDECKSSSGNGAWNGVISSGTKSAFRPFPLALTPLQCGYGGSVKRHFCSLSLDLISPIHMGCD
jgi:hypothetical protein